MTLIATKDLKGAALDWAVARAGEEWKTAHKHFPTMTLDPTFKGVHGDARYGVFLTPNNPMRQDPQKFNPSTCQVLGGEIIDREWIGTMPVSDAQWRAGDVDGANGYGPTRLIAAMRCFVASKLGDAVEVPEELTA